MHATLYSAMYMYCDGPCRLNYSQLNHYMYSLTAGVAIMDDDRLITELTDFVFGFRVWQVNPLLMTSVLVMYTLATTIFSCDVTLRSQQRFIQESSLGPFEFVVEPPYN